MFNINVNAKKLNIIVTSIIIAFVIIFSNTCTYSAVDTEKDSTVEEENNKEIEESIAEYDENIYSIEAIVYNKVPLFDINVFSDTSAGVKLKENSIENITKKTVATWYVAARNVTFVVLAILLIYTGMMMAITTVAEEKGQYKIRMIGWIKGITIAFVLHYLIYFIIYLNQDIVSRIAQVQGTESSIYNTIKTRAMDTRFSIGIPATIIYITLFITWLRFLWTYTKRTFNVYMLIVLGPLVVAKYTYELSSGKKSKLLSNWIQRFSTAVFIQSIHALFYTIFVSTALELASKNLAGFILALMILSFMLSADKIFSNIFKFNFSGKDIDDLDRPFKPKENLTGLFLSYSAVKKIIPHTAKTAYRLGTDIGAVINSGYNDVMDRLDKKNGLDNREIIRNKINAPLNSIDDFIANRKRMPKSVKRYATLRKMSRRKGEQGRVAKRVIKRWNNQVGKKFTSDFKFIKDVAIGGAEAVLAIPMWVNYGAETGILTGVHSVDRISEAATLASQKANKDNKKSDKQLDETIEAADTVYKESNNIDNEMQSLTEDEKKDVKKRIKDYAKMGMDKQTIKKTILKDEKIRRSGEISDKEIEKVINQVEEKLPDDVTEKDKEKIKQDAINVVRQNTTNNNINNNSNNDDNQNNNTNNNGNNDNNQNNNNNNSNNKQSNDESEKNNHDRKYSVDEVVEGVNSAILKYSFGEKYGTIGNSIEKISSANSKQDEKSKKRFGEVIDMNSFADRL